MLDSETKRRIDTARDILVGKIPNPASQVEQITIALIYKFMDDMDRESVEMGGKASFFSGEFEKYAWHRVFDPRMGGHEMLALYADAITRMPQNPSLPQLFRDIFKNAFLPYRDPQTLKLFLKTIDEFTYDHSERLGDAFEYLLSVMASQGDAGQFRTPRHIIDFMVEVIDPKKEETILDPACGTAGFLISAFKHILKANSDKTPGDLLNPEDRSKLMKNFKGYDISPDMVRLSLVNMYLHGFVQPQIHEYDTLTSEERWNDYADVILANPPFMSPKGGIKPHKRFSVQSNRSEVLFVDYMAEHLTPNGRAAIIVPEGIIFQTAGAYKQLRKMLVEQDYLWAVVSLPAGVFNPYAGVKTSILFLDREMAKKTDQILFVKVEADGLDLGAQRRQIEKNDLPGAQNLLAVWHNAVCTGNETSFDLQTIFSDALFAEKKRLAEGEEYNLSSERYRETRLSKHHIFPSVTLGDVAEIISGQSPKGENYNENEDGFPFYQGKTEFTEKYLGPPKKWTKLAIKIAENDDILLSVRAPVGPVNITKQKICIGRGLAAIRPDKSRLMLEYLFNYLKINEKEIVGNSGAVFASINRREIEKIPIPVPPLDVQREIVEEIEGYQRIIDGARQVVENWKSNLEFELDEESKTAGISEWDTVNLGMTDIEIIDGDRGANYPSKQEFSSEGYCLFLNTNNVRRGYFDFDKKQFISKEKDEKMHKGKLNRNDIILTTRGTVGNLALYDESIPFDNIRINSGMVILRANQKTFLPKYLVEFFLSYNFRNQVERVLSGSAQPQLPIRTMVDLLIPIPPIEIQKAIVDRIENERRIIEINCKVVGIFESKIKRVIERIWEE
jgi:type I restriction enzyme M protein